MPYKFMKTSTPHQTPLIAIAATLFAALSLTAMNTMIKLVQVYVNHDIVVFMRSLFSMLILLPILLVRRHQHPLKTQRYPLHLLRALVGVGCVYCVVRGLDTLSISSATLLFMTYPLFTPLTMFFFLKKSLSLQIIVAIALGFVGVVCVLNPTSSDFLQYGSLFALASGILGAIGISIIKKLSDTEEPSKMVFYFGLNATVLTFIPALVHWQPIPAIAWIELIATGLFVTLYQQSLAYALKHGKPATVITLMYSAIIFSAIVDWVMHAKLIHISTIIGFLCIVISVVLVAMFEPRP